MKLRKCNHCQQQKPVSAFSRSKNRSVWCRDCCAENARRWRVANLEKARQYDHERSSRKQTGKAREWQRFYRWLTRHGLRPEDYHELFEKQEGKCAICGCSPDENGQFLSIDHDHETGVVRGLLCMLCNRGLGQFRDDPERLAAAIVYLQNGVLTAG